MTKVTWLGQAGLLFEHDGVTIMIDPYLSDSCHKVNPKSWRRIPVNEAFLELQPDVLILTHDHLDHTDPETLEYYLPDKAGTTVLASGNAWTRVRKMGGDHNYVLFNRLTEFTVKGICFRAVYAEHSDSHAIGVVFSCDDTVYYITGDTLYNPRVFADLPESIDVVFLPINGKGNNMNLTDAARFAKQIGAKKAVPIHFGLFDELTPTPFPDTETVIPTAFQVIKQL